MPLASAATAAALVAGLVAAGGAEQILRLQDPSLAETSGLAVSARHPRALWVHNDGGAVARVVAIDRDGRTIAAVRLRGIDPYDPEALAVGRDDHGRRALFLGDLGDNLQRRPDVSVFRFREPARLRDQLVATEWFQFRYPDGPHDAEALLVDRDGRLWVATKDVFGGSLYRAPAHPRTDRTGRLTRVADVPPLVTDGTFLPDGRFVLRSYSTLYLYDAPGRLVARAPLPVQELGESVAVDGDRLLVGSEGVHSAVYAVPVPVAKRPPASRSPAAGAEAAERADGRSPTRALLAAALTAAALGLAAAAVLTSRRRRRW